MLTLGKIHEAARPLRQLIVLPVLRHSDHLAERLLSAVETQPSPYRILIRPQPASERLVDNQDERRSGTIGGGKIAATHERHAKRGEKPGRDGGRTHRHSAGIGIHTLE